MNNIKLNRPIKPRTNSPTNSPTKLTCIICHQKLTINTNKHVCEYRKSLDGISINSSKTKNIITTMKL